ncbi:MAG: GNAT family N-acetyltransferase [Chitinophagales bacterium]|nr:GNAT family N-acetyltransferase [Chitinophagales bacterium]
MDKTGIINTLRYVVKKGADILSAVDDFAGVRMRVFHEFPYLYEGTLEHEREYLQTYCKAANAFLFAAYDGDKMIGATTCIPLKDEVEEVRQPFLDAGMDIDTLFYFGESVLLPEYRGLGLGHRFFDEREAHVRSFGTYRHMAFCAVNREANHPLKPDDYRPNDAFWTKRGYRKNPDLVCSMSWLDIGETEKTKKSLTFWMKAL